MPPVPGSVEGENVELDMSTDGFQWQDHKTQSTVAVKDSQIVSILPDQNKDKPGYTILFVNKRIENGESDSQKESSYLSSVFAQNLPEEILSRHLYSHSPAHLDASLHVIVSTASGTGKGKSVFEELLRPFLAHIKKTDYQLHETQSDQHIIDLARSVFLPKAKEGVSQTILLLSGDGGLLDIVQVFFDEFEDERLLAIPNICLVPTGTGNAMANSIGLFSDSTLGLKNIIQGKPLPLPTFKATFSPRAEYITDEGRKHSPINPAIKPGASHPQIHGAVVASWGVHAAIVADSDTAEYRKYGVDRFKMAAKECLYPSDGSGPHVYRGTIDLTYIDGPDGKERIHTLDDTEHMYVLATMVSELEQGFTISPSSKPLDGSLRLVHFGPQSPENAMNLMTLAYQNGKHVNEDPVKYEEFDKMKITFNEELERWRRVCIDGKIVAVEKDGWVEIRREDRFLLNLVTNVFNK